MFPLKHQWLYLDTLNTEAAVRCIVPFYVHAHNSEIPHHVFNGQTPDEIYFGTETEVPVLVDVGYVRVAGGAPCG